QDRAAPPEGAGRRRNARRPAALQRSRGVGFRFRSRPLPRRRERGLCSSRRPWEAAMATLITNVRVWDGSGAEAYPADVLLEGERIAGVGPGLAAPRAETIDGGGATLMPGLIEAHAH